jgi:small subunit ribosomal protein S9
LEEKIMSDAILTVGRRKEAVARVRLKAADTGKILIKGRKLEDYMDRLEHINSVLEPLKISGLENKLDLKINVKGGGKTGQAGAIKLAIARAIIKYDETHKAALRKNGCLTSDSRKVERKKYGLAKARKKFQYSKR